MTTEVMAAQMGAAALKWQRVVALLELAAEAEKAKEPRPDGWQEAMDAEMNALLANPDDLAMIVRDEALQSTKLNEQAKELYELSMQHKALAGVALTFVQQSMVEAGEFERTGKLFRWVREKSGGVPPLKLLVDDATQLPPDFRRVTTAPDIAALRTALASEDPATRALAAQFAEIDPSPRYTLKLK